MHTIEELTQEIDRLKTLMDSYPKNSEDYSNIKAERGAFMRKRSKLRADLKKSGSKVSSYVSSAVSDGDIGNLSDVDSAIMAEKTKKKSKMVQILDVEEDLEREHGTQERIDEIKQAIAPRITNETPEVVEVPEVPVSTSNDSYLNSIRQKMQERMSFVKNFMQKEPEKPLNPETIQKISSANDEIEQQFRDKPKVELISKVQQLQLSLNLKMSPKETLSKKTHDELESLIKEYTETMIKKGYRAFDLAANWYIGGVSTAVELCNPVIEDNASFTLHGFRENLSNRRDDVKRSIEEMAARDPAVARVLFTATSGGMGLILTTLAAAQDSVSMDQKKFQTKQL